MSTINSLLESSASGWKNMQNDAARMASKWGKTGLLEGLGSEVNKNNMAMILENQAKQLVTEQSSTNVGGGSFTANQGEQWAGVALPLVRKVFGSLSTKEFMSVQPMNLPSGLVFFLDFQYGDSTGAANGKAAPTGPFGPTGDTYAAASSLYGETNPALEEIQQTVYMVQVDLLIQLTNSPHLYKYLVQLLFGVMLIMILHYLHLLPLVIIQK
jgi:hypothetical protein